MFFFRNKLTVQLLCSRRWKKLNIYETCTVVIMGFRLLSLIYFSSDPKGWNNDSLFMGCTYKTKVVHSVGFYTLSLSSPSKRCCETFLACSEGGKCFSRSWLLSVSRWGGEGWTSVGDPSIFPYLGIHLHFHRVDPWFIFIFQWVLSLPL